MDAYAFTAFRKHLTLFKQRGLKQYTEVIKGYQSPSSSADSSPHQSTNREHMVDSTCNAAPSTSRAGPRPVGARGRRREGPLNNADAFTAFRKHLTLFKQRGLKQYTEVRYLVIASEEIQETCALYHGYDDIEGHYKMVNTKTCSPEGSYHQPFQSRRMGFVGFSEFTSRTQTGRSRRREGPLNNAGPTFMVSYTFSRAPQYTEVWYLVIASEEIQETCALYHGYDDIEGRYKMVIKDHITYRYEVLGVMGKGSFGRDLKCRDHKTQQLVAMKVIANNQS
ncbi:unnamed protein product [Arctogadus glacialis]